MITRSEFFEELLRGTTGRLELRRMKWNPRKNGKGAYDMLERWFSRDITELEAFASNGGGDIFHGVNIRDDSGEARKKNISEIVCAAVDIDFKTTPKEQADEALATSIFAPTFLVNSGNGYHGYWLLNAPLAATEENISLIEAINKGLAQQFGGDYTHDATRILRTPGRKNSKYHDNRRCKILRADGPRYSVDDLKIFAVSAANSNGPKVDIGDNDGELPKRFQKLLAKHGLIGKTWRGERSDLKDQSRSGYDMAMADLLAAHKFTPEEAAAILRQMPSGKGADATRAYLEHTISKAFAGQEKEPEKSESAIEIENFTDLGNARRFEKLHTGKLVYSAIQKKWIFWNGKFWQSDITGAVLDFAQQTIQSLYDEALQATDSALRKEIALHATRTESNSKIRAMLELAQGLPELRANIDLFDKQKFLLNTETTTLDLADGEPRDFAKTDYLTKIAPVAFDAKAQCPRWEKFLHEVTEDDKDLEAFLRRSVGYCLTGVTTEQCFWIVFGSGSNGKTTFLETILALLGDYACQVKTEVLLDGGYEQKDYHLAELYGRRLALNRQ
jgi:D5-like protein